MYNHAKTECALTVKELALPRASHFGRSPWRAHVASQCVSCLRHRQSFSRTLLPSRVQRVQSTACFVCHSCIHGIRRRGVAYNQHSRVFRETEITRTLFVHAQWRKRMVSAVHAKQYMRGYVLVVCLHACFRSVATGIMLSYRCCCRDLSVRARLPHWRCFMVSALFIGIVGISCKGYICLHVLLASFSRFCDCIVFGFCDSLLLYTAGHLSFTPLCPFSSVVVTSACMRRPSSRTQAT